MHRYVLLLMISIMCSLQTLAQGFDSVYVRLDLKDGRTNYRMGEGIILDLSFTAKESGYGINSVTTDPPSTIDEISIMPTEGVFKCGQGMTPDYVFGEQLSPGTAAHILIPLNAIYRIDKPGRYSVHVRTHRVQFGNNSGHQSVQPPSSNGIETNDVTFEVAPMSEEDEQVIVSHLLTDIRDTAEKLMPSLIGAATGNLKHLSDDERQDARKAMARAEELGNELSWLGGDPSTRAKAYIFLHPEMFVIFTGMAAKGFIVARNQRLLLTTLEQGMEGSSQSAQVARVTAQLRAKLDGLTPAQTDELEHQYLSKVARSSTVRANGDSLDANIALFSQLARAKQTQTSEFAEAREFLILHFSEVSPWYFDGLLTSYGEYLRDPRLVPILEAFLQQRQAPILMLPGRRDGVFKQLKLLAPDDVRPFAVAAVCDQQPSISFDVLAALPEESLPEVDRCLLSQLTQAGSSQKVPFEFTQKTMFLARFATSTIYEPMLGLYTRYGSKWPEDAQGAMLAYLVRYDTKAGLSLLKKGIKIGTGQPMNASESLCHSYFSHPVQQFLEYELQRQDDLEAVAWSAYLLSQYGPAEEKVLIESLLNSYRKQWSNRAKEPDPEQGRLERDLVDSLIKAKSWQIDEAEADTLKSGCISSACRNFQ